MLIISRKKDEKIMIGDNIEVIILETGRNRVRFGINAPRSVSVQTRLTATAPQGATPGAAPAETPKELKRAPAQTPALKT
jgi:carbon storage regulator